MIDTTEKLLSFIRLQYRFIKNAAVQFGFKDNRGYQRFRNTILGASRDYQVIHSLMKKYPKIDTKAIWKIDKTMLSNIETHKKR